MVVDEGSASVALISVLTSAVSSVGELKFAKAGAGSVKDSVPF